MWRLFVLPRVTVALLVLSVLCGCAEQPGPDENAASSTDAGPRAGDEGQTADEKGPAITVRPADRQVYDELLKQHQGKVVLVDCWATWCLSCMEQFPHTVELHKKYASEGLAVISVNFDEPENEPAVKEFLAARRAVFDNLQSKWGSGEQSFEAFDIKSGTLPEYKLYDRSGRLCETFLVDPSADKQFTPEDIERSVKALLAQSDAAR
jgi:thiol-disulfide isomerase/thioredoxin